MKKKVIAVGLLTTILCTSLLGCGGTSTGNEETQVSQEAEKTVSLRVCGSDLDTELLEGMAKEFIELHKEEASIDITVEVMQEVECRDKILSNVNEAPDVFTFADDQLRALVAGGILDETKYSSEIAEANIEGAVSASSINDKTYSYPLTADNGYFLYYNKKYISESDVETMDGLLAAAEKAGKKITMDFEAGWYLYSFFGNAGFKLGLNEDGVTNFCDFNKKDGEFKGSDVVDAMVNIKNNKAFMNANDDGLIAGIKDGSVVAGISGVWLESSIKEEWGKDYAAVKLPTYTCAGKQVQMASFAGYKMLGVNSYSKNREWAEEFARFISNEENQELRFTQRGQGPSNINAANSEAVSNSLVIQALLAQSQYASLQRIGENYWGPMLEFGQSIVNGTTTKQNAQSTLDKLVKNITSSLAS